RVGGEITAVGLRTASSRVRTANAAVPAFSVESAKYPPDWNARPSRMAQAASPATSDGAARRPRLARPAVTVRRLAAAGSGLLCALAAIYLGLQASDASHVRRANELGNAGRLPEAIDEAAKATHAPADARGMLVKARALTLERRLHEADAAWAALVQREPND